MFNLKNYVMNLIHKMIEMEVADYKVMKFALDYYEKEILTDDDMLQIELWLNPIVEDIPNENETEEIKIEI